MPSEGLFESFLMNCIGLALEAAEGAYRGLHGKVKKLPYYDYRLLKRFFKMSLRGGLVVVLLVNNKKLHIR